MKTLKEKFFHLKQKWGIKNNWDFFLINCVFSLAGMAVVLVRKPVFHYLGFNEHTHFWIKTITYLCILFPTYQLNLLIFGLLLGQFSFFWDKEKKLWSFLKRKLLFRA